MDKEQNELLNRCMAAMAAGDAAFFMTFMEHFGEFVRRVVRNIINETGRDDLWQAEIDGLVLDAGFVIFDRAAAWSPDGGAKPWSWAYFGIREVVHAAIGHSIVADADDLECEVSDSATGGVVDLGLDGCAEFLASLPEIVELRAALRDITSERNAEVFEHYRLEQRLGCAAPSHTVAAVFDLSPPNVRQIVKRVQVKLDELFAAGEYPAIAGLALVVG